jgi:hypothetical protein
MFPHLSRYAAKTHAELFEEARRPVDSLTPEHVDWLREQMRIQNRFYHGVNVMKTQWDESDAD